MYLHLGKGAVVELEGIVGIFDLDICSQSHLTRKYLNMAEKSGQIINVAEDIPKTFIIYKQRGKTEIYLSQMACATLLRRAESGVL